MSEALQFPSPEAAVLGERARVLAQLFLLEGAASIAGHALPQAGQSLGLGLLELAYMAAMASSLVLASRLRTGRGLEILVAGTAAVALASGVATAWLQSDLETAYLVVAALPITVAAVMPWGWPRQAFLVAWATFVAFAVSTAGGLPPPHRALAAPTVGCLLVSLVVAISMGRWHRRLALAESENALLDREVELRNTELDRLAQRRAEALHESTRTLEESLLALTRPLKAGLAKVEEKLLSNDRGPADGEPGEEERERLVDRARSAAARLRATLDALLDYVSLNRSILEFADIDLARLARLRFESLRSEDPGRVVEVSMDAPLVARGDPELLREALSELIENAWRFTAGRSDARIEVGSRSGENGLQEYFVRDNGPGLDPALAAKLFLPFQRLDPDRHPDNLGMGLARVAAIVRRHGGRVRLETKPGQGAAVWFTLGPAPRELPRPFESDNPIS